MTLRQLDQSVLIRDRGVLIRDTEEMYSVQRNVWDSRMCPDYRGGLILIIEVPL